MVSLFLLLPENQEEGLETHHFFRVGSSRKGLERATSKGDWTSEYINYDDDADANARRKIWRLMLRIVRRTSVLFVSRGGNLHGMLVGVKKLRKAPSNAVDVGEMEGVDFSAAQACVL
jgi:hypothetical protein